MRYKLKTDDDSGDLCLDGLVLATDDSVGCYPGPCPAVVLVFFPPLVTHVTQSLYPLEILFCHVPDPALCSQKTGDGFADLSFGGLELEGDDSVGFRPGLYPAVVPGCQEDQRTNSYDKS
ncbi:hypothetical protein ES707_18173 [subsurface metagenome]